MSGRSMSCLLKKFVDQRSFVSANGKGIHRLHFGYIKPFGKSFTTSQKSCFNKNGLFERLKEYIRFVDSRLSLVFVQQLNVIAAMRVRRAQQIMTFYRNLGYDTLVKNVSPPFREYIPKQNPLNLAFAAVLFCWKDNAVSQVELDSTIGDVKHISRDGHSALPKESIGDGWEIIYKKENLVFMRKPIQSPLFEYKVFGTFRDIPARVFYDIQVDLEYRKIWDKGNVVQLDIVDRDRETGNEVVHWVTNYPLSRWRREYVYVRKAFIDRQNNMLVMVSKATEHPKCPPNKNNVRVSLYKSSLLIKPHTSIDENGFDFVLSYYDDPQTGWPTMAYNWAATKGAPEFVETLHKAARDLHNSKRNPTEVSYEGKNALAA